MSATGIWNTRYQGGFCYAACQETFNFFNPSVAHCWRGCDIATGRVNDPNGRIEANNMCKRYAAELMETVKGELDNLEDVRVHADMYPTKPTHIFKACLAGIRRQKY